MDGWIGGRMDSYKMLVGDTCLPCSKVFQGDVPIQNLPIWHLGTLPAVIVGANVPGPRLDHEKCQYR